MDGASHPGRTIPAALVGLEGPGLLRAVIKSEEIGRIAAVSSFGAESAVLLHMVAAIDPDLPVIYLDTLKGFVQTGTYIKRLVKLLGLTNVRIRQPDLGAVRDIDPNGTLWYHNRDACCHIRKVVPMAKALDGFDAWINGRKRHHGGERSGLEAVEIAEGRIKLNPLASFTAEDIEDYMTRHGLPRHPLSEKGYASVGCRPCTRPLREGEAGRDGRWAGSGKTECGIHKAPWYAAAHSGPSA